MPDPHVPGFSLISSAFADQSAIPEKYTCQGSDISPPLAWSGVPTGTRSLALIVDDPDAPDPAARTMTWVHWVLYDISPFVTSLEEAADPPPGSRQGMNDWKRTGYGGPCPLIGQHRYFFKLYALDAMLGDLQLPTKAALEAAMVGRVLGEAVLMGTYIKR